MSNSTGSKVASVAFALVGTWATAQADILTVELHPTIDIDHLRVFSQQQVTNASTTVLQNQALSADFGMVAAGTTATELVTTNFDAVPYADARVGLVGSSGTSLLVGTGNLTAGTTFASNYGSTVPEDDITQDQAFNALGSGDATMLSRLFTKDDDNKSILLTRNDLNGKTGNLILFDAASGMGTDAGTWTVKVQAVPEPGTLAALSIGALAVLRRRRRG